MEFAAKVLPVVTALVAAVSGAVAGAPPSLERQAEFMSRWAACVDREKTSGVSEFLERGDIGITKPADIGWTVSDFRKNVFFPACVEEAGKDFRSFGTFNFDGALIRALLIEHRYLRANPDVRRWTAPDILPPRTFPILNEDDSLARSLRAADCMTLASPDLADKLIRTMRGSEEERIAAEALTPAFATCFVAQLSQPVEVEIAPPDMRRLTAESLWLLSGEGRTN